VPHPRVVHAFCVPDVSAGRVGLGLNSAKRKIWSGRWESNPRPKLGELSRTLKNVRIGGFFAFFGFFKWIPIGAATE